MQRPRSPRSFLSALARVVTGVALIGLTSSVAVAQGRLDVPAQGKIDEAINVHYLATDFAKAEELLSGTITACGNQCSAPIIAKAWMYIGIIRGAGKSDLRGAKEAFRNAVSVYSGVTLDNDLATPEVQAAFAEVRGQAPAAPVTLTPPPSAPAAPAAPPPPPPPPVQLAPMQCEPKVQEVQTRRPVPLSCVSQYPGVTKGSLYFKGFGEPSFSRVPMKRVGGAWQAELPCTATNMGSSVSWYVEVTDAKGSRIDGYGDSEGPLDIMLNDATAEKPPHFPGQSAPNRCADLADCPPEMLGTPACPGTEKPGAPGSGGASEGKGWGDACEEHSECQSGLACLNNACETAPSCSSDAECDGGHCDMSSGTCAYGEAPEESGDGSIKPGKQHMVALTFGMDFGLMNGSGVCDPVKNESFSCYYDDKPYNLATSTDGSTPTQYNSATGLRDRYWDGGSAAGVGFGSIRILLAYDMLLADRISAGANAGIALSPIPGGSMAIHADVHGKYWFAGNGKGLRPFLGAGLGLGRVDAVSTVQVVETAYEDSGERRQQPGATQTTPARRGDTGLANGTAFGTGLCQTPDQIAAAGAGGLAPTLENEFCQLPVQAATSYGSLFVAVGVGAWLNLGGHGPQLELYGKVLLPQTGVSIQPALSYVFGF